MKMATTNTKVQGKKVTTKKTPLPVTASNALKPSTMTGGNKGKSDNPPPVEKPDEKKRGNNRPKVAENDVKLQIRVSPEVAEILARAAAVRRCPLGNYCSVLLTDIALEADATPVMSKAQEREADAGYKTMFGGEK
jgi:hypothetical protein